MTKLLLILAVFLVLIRCEPKQVDEAYTPPAPHYVSNGDYVTYANATFFVMRESELGYRDTIRIDSITSMTKKGSVTELRNGVDLVYIVVPPKEQIIKVKE